MLGPLLRGSAALLLVIALTTRMVFAVSPVPLTHGVAVGEVSSSSAVVWGRCERPSTFRVRIGVTEWEAPATAARDNTAAVALPSLMPDTTYRYRAWCGSDPSLAVDGSFRTAPRADEAAPVRFAWGADVGGQNVCRDAERGYFIFERLLARRPAFFLALGDMIYADDVCRDVGLYHNRQIPGPPASTEERSSFWEHWRYARADLASQRFLLSTPYFATWDDHEIANDAGPKDDTLPTSPANHRLSGAREAFMDYQPMARGQSFYRKIRWGRLLEIFILDTRSYRDSKMANDDGSEPKSMLGAEQRRWLIDGLRSSDATWKFVVSSVPMAIPTYGDGWANAGTPQGFERELLAILRALEEARVVNLVWISADVHFAAGFRHTPFDGFSLLEFISGPLNAGMYPKGEFDLTLNPERLFFLGGPLPQDVKAFDQAWPFFNFGEVDIGADGKLTVRMITAEGKTAFEGVYGPRD